jgi:pSer/pThr/pTyr-binding forkhead associated (FHA) protein
MPAQLVPIGVGPVPTILLSRPVILIGRHPECDVRIDLPQISRRHCCVAMAYDRLVIRDLGSSHGVRVNGQVVEEAQLEAGDEVAIAHLIYRLIIDAPTPRSPTTRGSGQTRPADDEPIIDLSDDFIPLDD